MSKKLLTFVTLIITSMNTRLKQFLAAENITQAQFADAIQVVRASVSHVLSGRNNPSYDFIKAIMHVYPRLNIEWLFFGKGKMYKDQSVASFPETSNESIGLLFNDEPDITEEEDEILPQPVLPSVETPSFNEIDTRSEVMQHIVKQRKVSKIIVLFDDGSYQEL